MTTNIPSNDWIAEKVMRWKLIQVKGPGWQEDVLAYFQGNGWPDPFKGYVDDFKPDKDLNHARRVMENVKADGKIADVYYALKSNWWDTKRYKHYDPTDWEEREEEFRIFFLSECTATQMMQAVGAVYGWKGENNV